ncbi:hypothetical protein MT325_m105R [Paramecium bursaria chlorella virus MT325]|uniref:Uncharacterized protein m105R n=1 Tax=Paramecium bursaria Chlorella virus MT325 TaxID=346932 RepID=A7ITI5_PBCVM|nr:hypothetical protein MT325_m105R [Paramecium bursaria chlorella virus MT325]
MTFLNSLSKCKPFLFLFLAKIAGLKELRKHNDIGTVGRRVPHHALCGAQVILGILGYGKLESGDRGLHCVYASSFRNGNI